MNQPYVIALIAALPPTLVALAALMAAIRNGRKAEQVNHRLDGALEEWRNDIRELADLKATIKERARGDAEHAAEKSV